MSEIKDVISKARALLQSVDSDKALEFLSPYAEENSTNVQFLEVFGEALLESNQLENAYEVLQRSCSIDPQGELGVDKFFYMGQIIGGDEGLRYIDVGLQKSISFLEQVDTDKGTDIEFLVELAQLYPSKQELRGYLLKKINLGIFGQIEIWMTDLCMEPQAENECEKLINYSLSLEDKNPEAYSLLSSIRISQQRPEEAKNALLESWKLFQEKRDKLEQANADKPKGDRNADPEEFENTIEYLELTQPLMNLAKLAIELELYEVALCITSCIQEVNENILETYYYDALSNIFMAKRKYSNDFSLTEEDYRDIELAKLMAYENEEVQKFIEDARYALTNGYKILNSDLVDADPDLMEQVSDLVNELGGPIMSELLPNKKIDVDEDIENWEEELSGED